MMSEGHKALLGVAFALDMFYHKFPKAVVHTLTCVLSGQHGGWDITIKGTEDTNFDEVEHTEVYR